MKSVAFPFFVIFMASSALAAEMPSMTETELAAKGFLTEGTAIEECGGAVGVLRFSEPKEAGTFAGFKDAVARHRDWLHAKGFEDVTFAVHKARMGRGGQIGFGSLITYPTAARYAEVGAAREDMWDESYAGFVTQYKAHTENYRTITLCLETPGEAGGTVSPGTVTAEPGE